MICRFARKFTTYAATAAYSLFDIGRLRAAGHVDADGQQFSTERELRQFRRRTGAGAGDVQRAQVGAAEGHRGRAAHRQRDLADQLTGGRQLGQPRAFEHRDPVIAFAIDRGAVGTAAVVVLLVHREMVQQVLVGDGAGGDVEIQLGDAVGAGVGVVHGAVVRAEAQAIRVGHAARPGLADRAAFQHEHLGGRLVARLVDGADPEASCAVDVAVVEAGDGGVVWRGGDFGQAHFIAVGVEVRETAAHGDHQAALVADGQGGRLAGELPRTVRAAGGIEAVHGEGGDVDPVQRLLLRVPQRALAGLHDGVVGDFDMWSIHRDHRCCAALAMTIRPLVELSWRSGLTSPASSAWIFLARTLPSSTPHWSKLLTSQITPCTKVLCSYSAISAPSVDGVSWSIKMVLDGRLPGKVLCGTSSSISASLSFCAVRSARTSAAVLPVMKASDCAKQFANS